MKVLQLKTKNGEVLYERKAKNWNEFFQILLNEGQTNFTNIKFGSRPDRAPRDLSKLDFSRCDFSGSTLVNVDFSSAKLSKSNFSNTTLKGCIFNSAKTQARANFSHSKLNACHFFHSTIRNTNFSSCELNDCNFGFASIIGTNFSNSVINDSYFLKATSKKTNWENAQINDSTLAGVDFIGNRNTKSNDNAVSSHNAQFKNTRVIDSKGLDQDGNIKSYETKFDHEELPALQRDITFQRVKHHTLPSLTSMAIGGMAYYGLSFAPDFIQSTGLDLGSIGTEGFQEFIGGSIAGLIAIAAKDFITGKFTEFYENKVSSLLNNLLDKTRDMISTFHAAGKDVSKLYTLITTNEASKIIMNLAQLSKDKDDFTKDDDKISIYKKALDKQNTVLIVSNKNLPKILELISKQRHEGITSRTNLTIILNKKNKRDVPSILKFNIDGTAQVGWMNNNELTHIAYFCKKGLPQGLKDVRKNEMVNIAKLGKYDDVFSNVLRFENRLIQLANSEILYSQNTHFLEAVPGENAVNVKHYDSNRVSNRNYSKTYFPVSPNIC